MIERSVATGSPHRRARAWRNMALASVVGVGTGFTGALLWQHGLTPTGLLPGLVPSASAQSAPSSGVPWTF